MAIANGFLTLNLRAEDAISFLFVTFEHLASCTKNLGDVYSVLLNGVWGFGLNRGAINLTNVLGCARRKNAHHGVVALVDPMIGNDASWWSVASNIRNESQHMDATSILTTPVGRPLNPSNIRNRVIHPLLRMKGLPTGGNHIFRRFRMTWLRENSVSPDIERFWLGHANRTVGDDYSMLKKNVKFRKQIADKIGVGFELPNSIWASVVPNVPKMVVGQAEQAVA